MDDARIVQLEQLAAAVLEWARIHDKDLDWSDCDMRLAYDEGLIFEPYNEDFVKLAAEVKLYGEGG